MGLAELAGEVAWSAWRSLLPAIRTSVVDLDSTLMTEAVGLATLILARPFIEISSALVLLFLFLRSQYWLPIRIYHSWLIKMFLS